MKILLIEDQIEKRQAIVEYLKTFDNPIELTECYNLLDVVSNISSCLYDLIIFDIFLPIGSQSTDVNDVSHELIGTFSRGINHNTETIALTAYNPTDIPNLSLFNEYGVTVVHYDVNSEQWKNSLRTKIEKVLISPHYDFLIFCALTKERSAFENTDPKVGDHIIIHGIDCRKISINESHGLCICPARMGLVSMAIVASKAIELFKPKFVAMSGICAGVRGESNLLDIIVGDVCWEYQTGKYMSGEFKSEPYQSNLMEDIRVNLKHFTSKPDLINKLHKDYESPDLVNASILLAPLSSGSAVIADADVMQKINQQHRKMAGLEMEMYALYEAAHQSLVQPKYFGAKAVVDLGDKNKSDNVHEIGCLISARFVIEFLKHLL